MSEKITRNSTEPKTKEKRKRDIPAIWIAAIMHADLAKTVCIILLLMVWEYIFNK